MNSQDLIQYVRDLTGVYASDVVSDSLITRWLNESYSEVARDRDWDWLETTYRAALPAWTDADPVLHFGYHEFTLPNGTRRVLSAYLVGENGFVDELVQTSDIDHVEESDSVAKYDVNPSGSVRIVPKQDPNKSVKFRYTRTSVSLEPKYNWLNTLIAPVEEGASVIVDSGAPGSGDGVEGDYYFDTTNEIVYGPKNEEAEWPVLLDVTVGTSLPPMGPYYLSEVPTQYFFNTVDNELYSGDTDPLSIAYQSPAFDEQFHSILAYKAAIKLLQFTSDDTNRSEYYMMEYNNLLLGMYDMYENDHDYRTFSLGQDGVNTRKYFPWFRPS